FAQSASPVDSAPTRALADTLTATLIPPPKPRPSPMAVALHKEEGIYLKVTYCQPIRKGRGVFTELAPHGKLWRTGANEATEVTLTKDVRLAGKILKAGTYALFTVPNADKWRIIFNAELGQWGEYKYDPAKDVLTFEVPAQKNDEVYEAFTIRFNETATGADMSLMWASTKAVVPFAFTR
ncbi:MAG: DUF2911 domain-containing protein, partial [Ferruginibacter sp.]|nr:DUF2911 domain-containing protein [Cytophagales bacterium]